MTDLNSIQINLINDLAILITLKTNTPKTVHCCRLALYNHLENIFPRDGSSREIELRLKKESSYKANSQIKRNIL